MRAAILLLLAGSVGCKHASPDQPAAIRIDEPERHWRDGGFAEMVAPLLPPTSVDGRDRITVWLQIPDGGRIELGASLRYPPGTVGDRVEYEDDQVVDVRGTRFAAAGAELFHVLRANGDGLVGYEWRRGDAALERRATELAGALVPARMREQFRRFNDCAGCHQHDRPPAPRADAPPPWRATDSSGLYQVRAVLTDAAPLDRHRPREANLEGPFLRVDCGGHPAELRDDGGGARHYACTDGGVPVGHFDVERARLAGDAHALAVCRSRRYLMEHMDEAARAAFAAAFRACGF